MLLSDTHKVADIVNGSLSIEEEIKFKGVCTDTRKRVADRLFIALEGEILMDTFSPKMLKNWELRQLLLTKK